MSTKKKNKSRRLPLRVARINQDSWDRFTKIKERENHPTFDKAFTTILDSYEFKSKEPLRQEKKTKLVIPKEKVVIPEKPFDFPTIHQGMFQDKDERMPIIAYYWQIKGWTFETKDSYTAALRRELRPASNLKGYSREKIKQAVGWLKKNVDFKWTLETVHKFIDEPLEQLGQNGRLKTEDDVIRDLKQKYAIYNTPTSLR